MNEQIPTASDLKHLKPNNVTGALYTLLCVTLTIVGVGLTQLGALVEVARWLQITSWVAGHVVFAFALLQWFVLLHECGHGVLFRSRLLNEYVGHLSGFFCFIPFRAWSAIHAAHHKWTGWQDLDPTTAPLVPRELGTAERLLMNFCWKYWVPVFAVLYRVTNFWNPGRLKGVVRSGQGRLRLWANALTLLVMYGVLLWLVGPLDLLLAIGLGFLISLMMIEPIMISQHSHIPLKLSGGEDVKAIRAKDQGVYTRSLRFPDWFSRVVLLHFDAHEVHHVYPYVPGYALREIDYAPQNEANWWTWIRMARRLPAEKLLFQNRNDTGSEV